MTNGLDMGGNILTGVSDPISNHNAFTYADTFATTIGARVAKTGNLMSGALNMGYNKIKSLDNPTDNQDAAKFLIHVARQLSKELGLYPQLSTEQ